MAIGAPINAPWELDTKFAGSRTSAEGLSDFADFRYLTDALTQEEVPAVIGGGEPWHAWWPTHLILSDYLRARPHLAGWVTQMRSLSGSVGRSSLMASAISRFGLARISGSASANTGLHAASEARIIRSPLVRSNAGMTLTRSNGFTASLGYSFAGWKNP